LNNEYNVFKRRNNVGFMIDNMIFTGVDLNVRNKLYDYILKCFFFFFFFEFSRFRILVKSVVIFKELPEETEIILLCMIL